MHDLEIRVDIPAEKRREFLVAAADFLERVPDPEIAPRNCEVFERHRFPNHFLWREEWPDRATLELRMASSGFRTLIGALRALGARYEMSVMHVEQRINEQETH